MEYRFSNSVREAISAVLSLYGESKVIRFYGKSFEGDDFVQPVWEAFTGNFFQRIVAHPIQFVEEGREFPNYLSMKEDNDYPHVERWIEFYFQNTVVAKVHLLGYTFPKSPSDNPENHLWQINCVEYRKLVRHGNPHEGEWIKNTRQYN